MAPRLKNVCRLCARKHEYLKDLLDSSNKSVVDLIRQFTQITVSECENMPTKLCLDCEEKLVSFQLFILECYKAQDTLRQISTEESLMSIKVEVEEPNLIVSHIKSEVKDDLTVADIEFGIMNETDITEIDDENDYTEDMGLGGFEDDDMNQVGFEADDDDQDNITIASLKKLKNTEEDMAKLNDLIVKKNTKARDFVRLECLECDQELKNWSTVVYHYYHMHKSKPVVNCLCGFPIKSLSSLYKHVGEHKGEKPSEKNDEDKIDETTLLQRTSENLKVKDFVEFQCTTCNRPFSSWYRLSAHTQQAHCVAPVVQCSCGITLKSKSCLYKHIADHKTISTWSCDQCALVTKSEEALRKHKLRHIPKSDRKFHCPDCDKIFTSRDACRSHQRKHIPVEERQKYQCDQCQLKFTTRSSAATHKRVVHEKVKSYVCDQCGYACGTGGELRQHRAIHSDDKPFVCTKCSKPFKTYSNLKTHMDTHEGTSYACRICSRTLNSRRTLRKHLLVHEEKCRHVCSYCNKAFKRRQTLKVHMYTHTGVKPLTCKWCGDRFAYASTLRAHRLRFHTDKAEAQADYKYEYALQEQQQEYDKNDLSAVEVAVAAVKHDVEMMT